MRKLKLSKKAKRKAKQYVSYLGIILVIFLILLLTKIDIIQIVMILIFIIIGCFSKFYKRFTSLSIGFELVTLATILFAYQIGIVFAILAATFMVIVSEFISGKFVANSISNQVIASAIISVFVGIGFGLPFIPLALTAMVIRNVSVVIIGVLFLGAPPVKVIPPSVANIIINWFIISRFGELLLSLL